MCIRIHRTISIRMTLVTIPKTHFAYSKKNKKVLGKMKDEYNGCPVKEFVGLRPKMYSIMDANNDEKKTAKSISK